MIKTVRSIAAALSAAALFAVDFGASDGPMSDRVKGAKLVNFLRWAYKDGEKTASALDYAPLPASMVAELQNRLKSIKVNGATNVGDAR